jgi:hypothetical protein
MSARRSAFALCIENRGAEDLEIRKVDRVLPDKAAMASGYLRVIDESGEDYLYPGDYFVPLELPPVAKRALALDRQPAGRRRSPNKPLQRPRHAY